MITFRTCLRLIAFLIGLDDEADKMVTHDIGFIEMTEYEALHGTQDVHSLYQSGTFPEG
jgi:hypothetical protein